MLSLAVLLGACSAAPASTSTIAPTTPPPSATPAATPSASAAPSDSPTPAPSASAAAAFPVTLTDDEGTKVSIAAQPTKIVSLMPAVTETLFALGVGDKLVGKAQDISLYPPQASAVPDVEKFDNGAVAVDVEKIVASKADLVIAGGDYGTPTDTVTKLRGLGIPVLVVYAPNVAGVMSDITLIGKAVGKPDAAAAMASQMQAAFDAVKAAVSSAPSPRVYYEIGEGYAPADGSFLAEMITDAGGMPITSGSTTKWDLSAEKLLKADPQIVLLADFTKVADAVKRPGWLTLTAVKNNAVAVIDDTMISRPGPRLYLGLQLLAAAIHPDLTIPQTSPIPAVP
ncbi:MAG TPA: ABC transporter substrate-binding protein [Candidatus Limnocylindrales bacterium]